jgi:hypothetical protein
MEQCIEDTVIMIRRDKDLESSNGLMVQSMLGNGKITRLMEMENSGILMGTFMKVIGRMIVQTVMGLTYMLMDLNILVHGKMISNMVKV